MLLWLLKLLAPAAVKPKSEPLVVAAVVKEPEEVTLTARLADEVDGIST